MTCHVHNERQTLRAIAALAGLAVCALAANSVCAQETLHAGKAVPDMQPPFNAPSPIPDTAPMNGFVQDYIDKFTVTQGRAPTKAEYGIIMNCFPADAVPVIMNAR